MSLRLIWKFWNEKAKREDPYEILRRLDPADEYLLLLSGVTCKTMDQVYSGYERRHLKKNDPDFQAQSPYDQKGGSGVNMDYE